MKKFRKKFTNEKLIYCIEKYRKIVRSRIYNLLFLFYAFFRIGSMTFGSGLTLIPILQAELVEKHHWVKVEDLLNYYALSQGIPGILMVNISCFVGYHKERKLGALIAALGVVTPSIIVITGIAKLFTNYSSNTYIVHAMNAVSACICAFIFSTTLNMVRRVIKDIFSFLVFLAALCLNLIYGISPAVIIPSALLIGCIYCKVYRTVQIARQKKLSEEMESDENFDVNFS